MFYGGKIGVILVVIIAAVTLIRSHINFKKTDAEKTLEEDAEELKPALSEQFEVHKTEIAANLRNLDKMVTLSMRSLVGSNKDILLESTKRLVADEKRLEKNLKKAFRPVESFSVEDQITYAQLQIQAHQSILDVYKVANRLASNCLNHITNFGGVPRSEYLDFIIDSEDEIKRFIDDVRRQILADRDESSGQLGDKTRKLREKFERTLHAEVSHFTQNEVSNRLARLQVSIILDLIQLVEHAEAVYRVHNDFVKKHLTK